MPKHFVRYLYHAATLRGGMVAGLFLLTVPVAVYPATSATGGNNSSGGGPPPACIKDSSQATAFDGIPVCIPQQNSNIYTDTSGTVTNNTNSTENSNNATHQTSMNGYSDIELVRRYLYGKWQISLPATLSASGLCDMPDSSIPKDNNSNPAFQITKMYSSSSDSSATSYMPQHGDIMVYGAQSHSSGYPCSTATPNGHVGIVDSVDSA